MDVVQLALIKRSSSHGPTEQYRYYCPASSAPLYQSLFLGPCHPRCSCSRRRPATPMRRMKPKQRGRPCPKNNEDWGPKPDSTGNTAEAAEALLLLSSSDDSGYVEGRTSSTVGCSDEEDDGADTTCVGEEEEAQDELTLFLSDWEEEEDKEENGGKVKQRSPLAEKVPPSDASVSSSVFDGAKNEAEDKDEDIFHTRLDAKCQALRKRPRSSAATTNADADTWAWPGQLVSRAEIGQLAKRAGVERVGSGAADEVRSSLVLFLRNNLALLAALEDEAGIGVLREQDVQAVLKKTNFLKD